MEVLYFCQSLNFAVTVYCVLTTDSLQMTENHASLNVLLLLQEFALCKYFVF
jgi:hypothetical protein